MPTLAAAVKTVAATSFFLISAFGLSTPDFHTWEVIIMNIPERVFPVLLAMRKRCTRARARFAIIQTPVSRVAPTLNTWLEL